MKTFSTPFGAVIALPVLFGSMLICAAAYRSSPTETLGLSQESTQIHELWHAVLERSSKMKIVQQKLLKQHSNERSRLIVLKTLDGLLDSVRRDDPKVVMGIPSGECEVAINSALDEAKTLVKTYQDYIALNANKEQSTTKDLESAGSRAGASKSAREQLLQLVGEQALARLDRQLTTAH